VSWAGDKSREHSNNAEINMAKTKTGRALVRDGSRLGAAVFFTCTPSFPSSEHPPPGPVAVPKPFNKLRIMPR
jgi:hypothetical protein